MIQRQQYINAMHQALRQDKLLLLLGTRQVGKTTLMHALGQEWKSGPVYYCNTEEYLGLQFASKQSFIERLQGMIGCDVHKPGLLLLDEIQSIPHIETLLKTLYDDPTVSCHIIATGSRFRGQSIPGSTLVGRGNMLRVYPLSFREFLIFKRKSFDDQSTLDIQRIQDDLLQYLTYGGYPAVVLAKEHEQKTQILNNIILRVFEKDFSYFLTYNDIISCKKVFEWIVSNTGSLAKIDNISTALGLSREKVKTFLRLLEESYLVYSIYPYYHDISKEYGSKPKLYVHDTGVFSLLTGNNIINMHDGRLNETVVLHQLLRRYDQHHIHYYRKKHTQSEIDFVVNKQRDGLTCIEAKSQDNDTIPRIFFEQQRKEDIAIQYIKTTGSLYTHRTRDHIACQFSPRRDLQLL